jgi:uncharacterized integral membrane protein
MIGSKLLHRSHGKRRGNGLGLWWTFALGLILGGALIVAIVQNSHHVKLHYLVWHLNVSLIVVVLTTALIAFSLDEVGGLIWRRRRRLLLDRRNELKQLRTDTEPQPEDTPADPPEPEFPSK